MQNISKPLITPAQLILSLILFLCMTAAFADPSAGIGNFLSQVGEEDFSANVIRKTFGDGFVDSIGVVGAADSGNILGQMFSIFNTALLAVAMFYFGYQSVSSVAATAEEGSFMGQRFSTVWVPIRFTIGVVSLVPMFGGFGGAQVIFMWFTKIGIGMANAMVIAGLSALSLDPNLLASRSNAAQQESLNIAKALFDGHNCVFASAQDNAAVQASLPSDVRNALGNSVIRQVTINPNADGDSSYRVTFTSADAVKQNRYICGGVRIATPGPMETLGDENMSTYSESVSSIGSTYQTKIFVIAKEELEILNEEMRALSESYTQNFDSTNYRADIEPKIKASAAKFDLRLFNRTNAEIPEAEASNAALKESNEFVTRYGWLMLGSFYQTIATAQSVFDQTTKVNITPIEFGGGSPAFAEKAKAMKEATDSSDDGNSDIAIGDLTSGFGQSVVLWTSRFALTDSTQGTFNPIMEMKDLGDTIINAGATVFAAYVFRTTAVAAVKGAGDVLSGIPVVGKVFSGIATVASSAASSFLQSFGPFLILLVMALFFFGFMLSVYIPMLPFITWYGGIIGWFSSVIESLVAAPVGAFIHLDAEGQGMGQRTQHTYLFLMNVLLRPALMVFGFFAASLGVMILGKVLFLLFIPAMATAQTDSWTGLVMVIGYIFVFMSLALTMVHGAFNLIHIIPDSVISWAGGHISTKMGQDTDNNTLAAFTKGSSRSDNAASQSLGRVGSENPIQGGMPGKA